MEDAGVIHHSHNKSDHCLVYFVFNSLEIQQESFLKKSSRPKPSWRHACAEERNNYRNMLDEKLDCVICPASVTICQDVHCKSKEHREMLIIFEADVLYSIQEAAESTLPTPKATSMDKHKKSLACLEEVKEHKETASFWFNIWMSAGRPTNTQLHTIIKRTRKVFHFVIRKCKKNI